MKNGEEESLELTGGAETWLSELLADCDPEALLSELLRDWSDCPLPDFREGPPEQPMAEEKSNRPWDRQPGEPALWFGRFDTFYRPLGPERSLRAAYTAWQAQRSGSQKAPKSPGISVSRSWRNAAEQWRWRVRAEAWDAAERERLRAEEEEERRKDREQRIKLLKAYRARLVQALQALKPENARWAEVTAGIRAVGEELRTEYGDQPAQRHEITGQGGGPVRVQDVDAAIERELERLVTARQAGLAGAAEAEADSSEL